MNINFGLFPPIEESRIDENGKKLRGPERGAARKRLLSERAKRDLERVDRGRGGGAVGLSCRNWKISYEQ